MTVTIPYTFTPNTTIQSAQVNADFSALATAFNSNTRTILNVPTTFYISPTGSDTVSGLNPVQPAATVNYILALLGSIYDVNNQIITIQLANGSYSQNVLLRGALLGQQAPSQLIIQGNIGAPNLVTFSGSPCFQVTNGAMCRIQGMTLTSPANHCLLAAESGQIGFQNVVFSTAVGAHLRSSRQGDVFSVGDYSITGGAGWHASAGDQALVTIEGSHNLADPPPANQPTITLTGTPSFANAFVQAGSNSTIFCTATFVGSATGLRGNANTLSVINTNGNPNALTTYFPGSVNPTQTNGGIIV